MTANTMTICNIKPTYSNYTSTKLSLQCFDAVSWATGNYLPNKNVIHKSQNCFMEMSNFGNPGELNNKLK